MSDEASAVPCSQEEEKDPIESFSPSGPEGGRVVPCFTRVNGSHFFFEWHGLPADITDHKSRLLGFVHQRFSHRGGLKAYCIGQFTSLGCSNSLYAYVRLFSRIDIRSNDPYIFLGVAPFIRAVGHNPSTSIRVATSSGNYISMGVSVAAGATKCAATRIIHLAGVGKHREAICEYKNHFPKDYLKHGSTVESNIRRLSCVAKELKFPLSSFHSHELAKLDSWKRDSESLILSGPTGTGKTKLAQALIGPCHLFVRDPDTLKQFNPDHHTGVVFDDMSLTDVRVFPTLESVIHILDVEEEAQVRCRYASVTLPAGIPRVFTTNRRLSEFIPDDPHGSLVRRMFYVRSERHWFAKPQVLRVPESPVCAHHSFDDVYYSDPELHF